MAIMRWGILLAVVVLNLIPSRGVHLYAQEVRVSEPKLVTIGFDGHPLIEPHLSLDPADPDHLLGAVMVSTTASASNPEEFARVGRERTCAVFGSLDGGETWESHEFDLNSCYDPWVAITAGGSAVFSVIASDPSVPDQGGELLVYHSEDGGRTWDSEPTRLGTRHDHQTMAVDESSPEREDWIYIVSSRDIESAFGIEQRGVFAVRSQDGGKTFDIPTHLVPTNLMVNVETAVVSPDGALLIPYVDPWRATPDGVVDVQYRRGWILRSEDGSYSFSSPNFAIEGCGPPRFSLSAASADVGVSSPWRGRVYFACNERGGSAVLLAYSPDGGRTWSEPTRIGSADGDSLALRQVMAMAVSDDGVLGVAWIERSGTITDEIPYPPCYEVFFSASVDGGRTFLPEETISTDRSCASLDVNGATARAWPNGGDYFGMVSPSDGRFRLLWPETRTEPYRLYTVEVWIQPG